MACNGRQFNSIEEDVCQLVYVERAEVFKSEDVSLFGFVFLALQRFLTGLFGLGRTLQELLNSVSPNPISRSSAVSTWESLFGDFMGFMPHHCSVSPKPAVGSRSSESRKQNGAGGRCSLCCDEDPGCGLMVVVDHFLF